MNSNMDSCFLLNSFPSVEAVIKPFHFIFLGLALIFAVELIVESAFAHGPRDQGEYDYIVFNEKKGS